MAEVVLADEARLRAVGFDAVCHVPVLFGRSGELPARKFYCREYNRYLRERAVLEWSPGGRTAAALKRAGRGGRASYPTRKSLADFAERLANFDDWLTETGRDWRTIEYTAGIVLGYQADMLAGRWSKDGRGLSAATVNVRVGEACNFLRWAAERKLRDAFHVVYTDVQTGVRSGIGSHGERGVVVQSRAGGVGPDAKSLLEVPASGRVDAWLRAVQARRGHVKGLMCRFALGGALRRSEVTKFRYGDFPDPDEGGPGGQAKPWTVRDGKMALLLRHGTKGRRPDPVGAPDRGPERLVWVPVELAHELLAYRRRRRLRAANLFRKREKRLPTASADFFLSDHDGRPVSEDTFYRAWKTEPLPMAGWHPHNARDYWACTTLLARLEEEANRMQALARMPEAWIYEVGRTVIETVIRPQLGHAGVETTMHYLEWIKHRSVLAEHHVGYVAHLEGAGG